MGSLSPTRSRRSARISASKPNASGQTRRLRARRHCSFSMITLCTHELAKSQKLNIRIAARYPQGALRFSDAIDAVRRKVWAHQTYFMLRSQGDSIEIPRHIWHPMQERARLHCLDLPKSSLA
jgi:hypothetical protein